MTACFHTGYFLLRTLRPLADAIIKSESTQAGELTNQFEKYVDHFCSDFDEVLPLRTEFVKAINGIEDE